MATDRRVRGFVGYLVFFIGTGVFPNIRRELIGISNAVLLTAFAMTTTLAGCAQMDVVAERKTAPIREGGIEDEGTEDEGTEEGGRDGGNVCDEGPRIRVGDSFVSDCTTGESTLAFRYALCVCSDYPGSDPASVVLTTDSFNSSRIDWGPSSTGGSVGVNGYIQNDGLLDIRGSLRVAGDTEGRSITLSENTEIRVGQELEVKSAIWGDLAAVSVGGDARVGGDVRLDTFSVDNTLTTRSDATLRVSNLSLTNPVNQEQIDVEPPCACAPEYIRDNIPRLVAEVSEKNDNDKLKFGIIELENYTGPIKKQLPCGQFYLRQLKGTGELTLSITGRAALYVTEQVTFGGPVRVELDRDAEFDIYLAKTMLASDDLTFGAADKSERVRLFVGGTGTLNLEGEGAKYLFSGQVYAPRSELVVRGKTEIYGSVFVRRTQLSAPLTIHYDSNPIETGLDCSE